MQMLASQRSRQSPEESARSEPPWSKWYQPGSEDDAAIYVSALQKCKDVNEQLNSQPWWDDQLGLVASKVVESSPIRLKKPRLYDAAWVESLIAKERNKAKDKQESKPEVLQKVSSFANGVIKVATQIKPVIDIFVPQSPEYTVPYACLWIIFQGVTSRKEKSDSVLGLITSLSEDLPLLETYKDLFPNDEMKRALAEFYLHILDLLWRLSKYYSHNFFKQLTDAMLPRTKYNFSIYLKNTKKSATRLKTLCEAGHITEQRYIRDRIEILDSEIRLLSQQLQATRLARHYTSELIDAWHDDMGDIEDELRIWQALRFFTDMRDHWSQNGILPCVAEWRKLCDESKNSILWVSSESNGRQSWLTEFSIDLIGVCRSQGQLITFAMCDRPDSVRWTPQQLLKQLVAQLLNETPSLTVSAPDVFNARKFRMATSFDSAFKLLHSIVRILGSLVIVIDRLDMCTPDPDAKHASIVEALSLLVSAHAASLRVIITTAQVVSPLALPGLPISFATINTRRRPRRRET
ncbi:hypothetical protein NKR23_g6060 [Pleurostoma richardsiae]|uniref:Uncharacterized protein n=1 Tax=Pleurostoma richardsiae TaxID=41990 RepID=A0AA38RX28_9PEZI|nr:hypothetical protein NKR23_g6060 [Pleurostoma richardsiae]